MQMGEMNSEVPGQMTYCLTKPQNLRAQVSPTKKGGNKCAPAHRHTVHDDVVPAAGAAAVTLAGGGALAQDAEGLVQVVCVPVAPAFSAVGQSTLAARYKDADTNPGPTPP